MQGGKRPGAGRKPNELALEFRQFCRELINSKTVLESIKKRAEQDPVFALRAAEFGIGRPFQAVYVGGSVDHQHAVRTVELDDGTVAFTTPTALPAPGIN